MGGGQLDIDQCSRLVSIYDSTITNGPSGPGGLWVGGIEAYGTDLYFTDNRITYNSGHGICLTGAQNASVSNVAGTYTSNNSVGCFYCNGIFITNMSGFRSSGSITINQATAINGQYYGVSADGAGTPISNLIITNNCVSGNRAPGGGGVFVTAGTLGTGSNVSGNRTSGCP